MAWAPCGSLATFNSSSMSRSNSWGRSSPPRPKRGRASSARRGPRLSSGALMSSTYTTSALWTARSSSPWSSSRAKTSTLASSGAVASPPLRCHTSSIRCARPSNALTTRGLSTRGRSGGRPHSGARRRRSQLPWATPERRRRLAQRSCGGSDTLTLSRVLSFPVFTGAPFDASLLRRGGAVGGCPGKRERPRASIASLLPTAVEKSTGSQQARRATL